MADASPRVLVIGFGNPGRLDDGLGPALAEALEPLRSPRLAVDADYQLTVEDAHAVAQHDVVVFADAATKGPGPFYVERLIPTPEITFSTHSVSPQAVLGLAHELFQARTKGYVLGIRGYAFNEFGERLTPEARANLDAAIAFMQDILPGDGAAQELERRAQPA